MPFGENKPWNFNTGGVTFPFITTPIVTNPLVPPGQMFVMPSTDAFTTTITLNDVDYEVMKSFGLGQGLTVCHECMSDTGSHPLICKCSCHDVRTPEQRDEEAKKERNAKKRDQRAQRKLKAQLLKLRAKLE